MDPVEARLRAYYEAEAQQHLRPAHGERRHGISDAFALRLSTEGRATVLDVGSGPASDHTPFARHGISYVGIDLAVGNATLASESNAVVVPGSVFDLPFRTAAFAAGWSMSTLQHVPDERIDEALTEIVRVLEPGAPIVVGLWGGRDEVIEPASSWSGVDLPRHFTLRSHDRISLILGRHLVIESDETFAAGPSDWEYHVAHGHTPSRS